MTLLSMRAKGIEPSELPLSLELLRGLMLDDGRYAVKNGSFSVTPKTALTDIGIAVGGRQVIGLQLPDGEDAGTIVIPSHSSRRQTTRARWMSP